MLGKPRSSSEDITQTTRKKGKNAKHGPRFVTSTRGPEVVEDREKQPPTHTTHHQTPTHIPIHTDYHSTNQLRGGRLKTTSEDSCSEAINVRECFCGRRLRGACSLLLFNHQNHVKSLHRSVPALRLSIMAWLCCGDGFPPSDLPSPDDRRLLPDNTNGIAFLVARCKVKCRLASTTKTQ